MRVGGRRGGEDEVGLVEEDEATRSLQFMDQSPDFCCQPSATLPGADDRLSSSSPSAIHRTTVQVSLTPTPAPAHLTPVLSHRGSHSRFPAGTLLAPTSTDTRPDTSTANSNINVCPSNNDKHASPIYSEWGDERYGGVYCGEEDRPVKKKEEHVDSSADVLAAIASAAISPMSAAVLAGGVGVVSQQVPPPPPVTDTCHNSSQWDNEQDQWGSSELEGGMSGHPTDTDALLNTASTTPRHSRDSINIFHPAHGRDSPYSSHSPNPHSQSHSPQPGRDSPYTLPPYPARTGSPFSSHRQASYDSPLNVFAQSGSNSRAGSQGSLCSAQHNHGRDSPLTHSLPRPQDSNHHNHVHCRNNQQCADATLEPSQPHADRQCPFSPHFTRAHSQSSRESLARNSVDADVRLSDPSLMASGNGHSPNLFRETSFGSCDSVKNALFTEL
jgi:hypothetical protein